LFLVDEELLFKIIGKKEKIGRNLKFNFRTAQSITEKVYTISRASVSAFADGQRQ